MNYRTLFSTLLAAMVLTTVSSNCLRFEESDFDNTGGLANLLISLSLAGATGPQIFAIGQPDTSTVQGMQLGLQRPSDALTVGGKLIVVDNRLKRVLIYNTIPTTTGAAPDVALGMPDIHTGGIQVAPLPTNAVYINEPTGIATDGTKLIVVDSSSHRVLIWNAIPTVSFTPADVVLGQTDFTTTNTGSSTTLMNGPTKAAVCGGRLYVSDTQNNRVMGWNSIPTADNTPADFVFGQSNTTANTPGATSTLMNSPFGISCGGTTMFIADAGNSRVLYYAALPTATGAPASATVGQTAFGNTGSGATATELFGPEGVHVDTTNDRLYVADTQNNRVLYYSPIPSSNGPSAIGLLGQNAFGANTANNTSLSQGMAEPSSVFADANGRIYVAAKQNNRIMVWNSLAPATFAAVDYVVGQPSTTTAEFHFAGASLSMIRQPVDVVSNGTSLFSTSDINNRVLRWAAAPSTGNVSADSVLGQPDGTSITQNNPSVGAATVNMPLGMCATSDRLYVADQQNNRVLIWTSIPTTSSTGADLVLGQADFTSIAVNAGGSAAQNTLNGPNGVYCDSQRVMVTDGGNNRVLIWNSPPTANMQNADVVMGQADFTSTTGGAANLNGLRSVLVAEDKVIVADSGQHRVLIWNSIPTTNGVSPDIVIGQTDFTSTNKDGGQSSPNAQGFFSPAGLAYSNGALFVADLFNSRIMIYRSIPTANNAAADLVWGQSDFSTGLPNQSGISETSINVPFGLTVHDERLIVADAFNHRLISIPMSRIGLE